MINTEVRDVRDFETHEARRAISEAADLIRSGALVVFPTETVYGLGASALDEKAAERIYAAKGRPSDNPLIIHIADPSDASLYAVTSPLYERLAECFMPGPITVILPVREIIPKTVTASLPTVAVRCPRHAAARALIREAGVPIAAPSANLSGSPSPTEVRHVIEDMRGRVHMILDGGDCEIGLESTIVRPEADGTLTLLRPGGITVEMLTEQGFIVRVPDTLNDAPKAGETVVCPGMKYRHYAPKAPLFLLNGTRKAQTAFLLRRASELAGEGKSMVLLDTVERCETLSARLPNTVCLPLGRDEDETERAKHLFTRLRDADGHHPNEIYAPMPKKEGIGLALYNRMIRASAYQVIDLDEVEPTTDNN